MTPARFTRLPGKRPFDITDVIASGRGYRPIGGRARPGLSALWRS
uniref:Uncharacterized protein n=1 Tax=Anguilla anguilla TaxID=7936 RepID=A0A0E9WQ53_ANGAN